jgi:hypothetical protein
VYHCQRHDLLYSTSSVATSPAANTFNTKYCCKIFCCQFFYLHCLHISESSSVAVNKCQLSIHWLSTSYIWYLYYSVICYFYWCLLSVPSLFSYSSGRPN